MPDYLEIWHSKHIKATFNTKFCMNMINVQVFVKIIKSSVTPTR